MIIDNRILQVIQTLTIDYMDDFIKDFLNDESLTKEEQQQWIQDEAETTYQAVAYKIIMDYPQVAGYMFALYKDYANITLTFEEQQEQNKMTLEEINKEITKHNKEQEQVLQHGTSIDLLITIRYICKTVIDAINKDNILVNTLINKYNSI